MITTTMRATRTTPRLVPSARLLPRLALRTTALSVRHIPSVLAVRRLSTANPTRGWFPSFNTSPARHIGPNPEEVKQMLAALGYDSMEAFLEDTVPDSIRIDHKAISEHSVPALGENEMLRYAEKVSRANEGGRSFGGARYINLLKVIFGELSRDLCTITGFAAASLQPNSGDVDEYPGLSIIRAYHASRGDSHRDICLIPASAHGANPTPTMIAGMKVVLVKNLPSGYLDMNDLRQKATKHKDRLGAFMITYPSGYGVFEPGVKEACQIVHDNGGQVYLDDANLNTHIGLTNPARYGGDVCHLNLHKTFNVPHGEGRPGVGPICVASHLAPFLPSHPIVPTGGSPLLEAIASAPYGSVSVLLVSWAYIQMLGGQGLADLSRLALLKVNYIAHRLGNHYSLKYMNNKGRVAHGLFIDWEELERKTGLKFEDFVEQLQDYGFHSLTSISTGIMIELSKGESMQEIDRFCDALIWVRKEAEDPIASARARRNRFITSASHRGPAFASSEAGWNCLYSHEVAAPQFKFPWLKWRRPWPTASHADVHGCTHPMAKLPWTAMGLFVSIRAAAKTCIRSSSASTMLNIPRPPDMEKLSGLEVGDETESVEGSSHDEDSWYDEDSCGSDWPSDVDVD